MTRRRLPPYLSPRVLGLTLLALVLIAAMTLMGLWQLETYNQAQSVAAAETAQADPVPLDSMLGPDQAFTAEAHGRPVVVEGEYDQPQLLVDRGSGPAWLATPLVTEADAAILVVRGLAGSGSPPPPPPGRVRVVGSLQPSQARGTDARLGDDRVPTLSTAQLIDQFDHDLYSGYVVLTGQHPPSTLPRATAPLPDTSFTTGFRNLMYAVQWWLFGGFVVFMWWRIVREQAQVA
jgi:surfeit locus 1 family protein